MFLRFYYITNHHFIPPGDRRHVPLPNDNSQALYSREHFHRGTITIPIVATSDGHRSLLKLTNTVAQTCSNNCLVTVTIFTMR